MTGRRQPGAPGKAFPRRQTGSYAARGTTCATPSPHPHPTEWSSSVDPVFWILVACLAYFLLADLIDKL